MPYQYYIGGIAQALENPDKKSQGECTSASHNNLVNKKTGHAVVSNVSEDVVKHSKKRKLKGKSQLFNSPNASANELVVKKAEVSTASEDVVKHSKKRKLNDKSNDVRVFETNRPTKKVKREILEKSVPTPSLNKKPKNRVRENQQTGSEDSEKRIKKDRLDSGNAVDPEKEARTVFVGNLPLKVKRKDLKTLFSCYGSVESVRLRSVVPLKMGMSKKVAVIQNKFNSEKDSINAYVVMDSVENANTALDSNGMILQGHHIRVDLAGKKEHDHKLSVFVGNLPFNCQDEELYNFFGESFEMESVRVVRDSQTGICKGFGFVMFKSKDSVELALKMDKEFKGRQLRVMRSKKQQTRQHKNAARTGKQHKFEGKKPFEGVKSNKGVKERKRVQRKIKFANLLAERRNQQQEVTPGSTNQDGRTFGNPNISNKRKEMKPGANYKDGRTYGNISKKSGGTGTYKGGRANGNVNVSNKQRAMKPGGNFKGSRTYGNIPKKRGGTGTYKSGRADGNANVSNKQKAMKPGSNFKGGRTYGNLSLKRGGTGTYKDGRANGNANKTNKDGRMYGKGQRKNKFNPKNKK